MDNTKCLEDYKNSMHFLKLETKLWGSSKNDQSERKSCAIYF